jgi:predicted NAD/FAD-binding protein
VLAAIPYQENDVVLHTDERVMPRRKLAWAAWNYHIPRAEPERVGVTYSMNMLQRLEEPTQYFVTLNRPDLVDPGKVIRRMIYHHPRFGPESVAAQARRGEISGLPGGRTHFCGAYWGNGFHEDGVRSALDACAFFGEAM